jgi:hypothetical protein
MYMWWQIDCTIDGQDEGSCFTPTNGGLEAALERLALIASGAWGVVTSISFYSSGWNRKK